jgi:hypothetical protein
MLSTYFIIQIRAMITSKQYTQPNKKDQHDFILDQKNGCSHKATTTLDILGEPGWTHLRSSLSLNILQQALKMIRNLPRETKIMALPAVTHACLGACLKTKILEMKTHTTREGHIRRQHETLNTRDPVDQTHENTPPSPPPPHELYIFDAIEYLP